MTLNKLSHRIITISLLISTLAFIQVAHAKELHLLTWHEYIDPEIITQFETKFDAKVRFTYFETEQQRDINLAQTSEKFDIILVSESSVNNYHKIGWVEKIDATLVPNIKHIKDRWMERKSFAIPYMWGTTGIAFRKDLIKEPVTSWSTIYNPPAPLQGKVGILDDAEELVFMAGIYQGISMKEMDLKSVKSLRPLLKNSAKHANFFSLTMDESSELVTGELSAALFYNGDAIFLSEEYNKNIDFIIPKEGCGIWIDYWVIHNNSKNRNLAHEFLNFINEPAIASANALYTSYAPANEQAIQLLPENKRNDQRIFPSEETLNRCEIYLPDEEYSNQFKQAMQKLHFKLKK